MPRALWALAWFFLARLPALVALIPPADTPLIRLRLVLCVAEELLVVLVLVVMVRPRASLPTSYADFLWRSLGGSGAEARVSMDDFGLSRM